MGTPVNMGDAIGAFCNKAAAVFVILTVFDETLVPKLFILSL